MEMYFLTIIDAAKELNEHQDVVIDRWIPSEYVYGTVFRGGPSFNGKPIIEHRAINDNTKWIYCRNDNAVKNHLKNKENREEMFDDMTKVVEEFDSYVELTSPDIPWIEYDFDKVDINRFVEEIVDDRSS